MMKRKIYFFCSVFLCGSLQGAMAPAERALVPQVQLPNPIAKNPAQLDALMNAVHNKGKGHYVHDVQPTQPAATLDSQKILDREADKTLALRASRVNILSNAIKSRYLNDESYVEQIVDIFGGIQPIKHLLYAFCIDTTGCSTEMAVRQLNDMHVHIRGMRDWVNDAEAFPMIEELRNNNCRFDKLFSILHDNMGIYSFRNYKDVTGSTLDAMIHKKGVYPELSSQLRDYLVRKDKEEYQAYFPKGFANIDENMNDNFAFWALENSKQDLQQLSALSNSLAFQQASKINPELIQRLKDYRLERLYANANTPICEHAIKLLNTLYDPHWTHEFDHFSNDTEKFSHVDELRGRTNERGSLNEALSRLEDGMQGVSLAVSNLENHIGSTVDEIMYKDHLYPALNSFYRSYLIFKDKQKFHQRYPKWRDWQFDRDILLGALMHSRENRQELIEFENSFAWKNYLEKYGKEVGEPNDLGIILQQYKNKVQR